jgi:hypothetical protein
MKKSISLLMIMMMVLLSSVSAFASSNTTNGLNAEIPNDPNLKLTTTEQALSDAKQKLADTKHAAMYQPTTTTSTSTTITPNTVNSGSYRLYVNTIAENPGWNCGPAATLQGANWKNPTNPYFQSLAATPGGSSTYNLQLLEGTTQSSGTIMSHITSPYNAASGTGSYFVMSSISTRANLDADIGFDIVPTASNAYPMIANVHTSYLDYYNGTALDHFITVDGYTGDTSGNVTSAHVVDDNWSTTYQGPHWTTETGLLGAITYWGTNGNFIW